MSRPRKTNKVRRFAFGLVMSGLLYAVPAQAVPVLFYSDLDSGPVGAYVTVWGKDFGTAQGALKVGSTDVGSGNILSWSDNMVEFRLPSGAGSGIVLTDSVGGNSNTLTFTTRSTGKIYFISKSDGSNSNNGLADTDQGGGVGPWRDLSKVSTMSPGDVAYVRTGVYDEILKSNWDTHFWIDADYNGTPGNPVAVVAYPGELAIVGGTGSAATSRAIYLEEGVTDFTIAKFLLQANTSAVEFGRATGLARIRVVGMEASDMNSPGGTFGVRSCTDCKILGNHLYNSGQAGNKLAHLIYYGGWGPASNFEIAWNTLHDERGGRCIQVYAHQDNDFLSGLSIHDNVTYNCPYDCILVGKSDGAVKGWISDAAVYNNVAYSCGNAGIRIDNPGVDARILHNTVYDSSNGVRLQEGKSAEIRNNIFANVNTFLRLDAIGTLVMDHNGYDGNPPSQDTQAFQGNPLFTDSANGDFSLQATSPFKGIGVVLSPPLPEVSVPSSSNPDLGALGWVHHATTPASVPVPKKPVQPTVTFE